MECALCNALKHTAETLEREFDNARGLLGDFMESPAARHQQARRITEDARLNYEVARLELEQHIITSHQPRGHS